MDEGAGARTGRPRRSGASAHGGPDGDGRAGSGRETAERPRRGGRMSWGPTFTYIILPAIIGLLASLAMMGVDKEQASVFRGLRYAFAVAGILALITISASSFMRGEHAVLGILPLGAALVIVLAFFVRYRR